MAKPRRKRGHPGAALALGLLAIAIGIVPPPAGGGSQPRSRVQLEAERLVGVRMTLGISGPVVSVPAPAAQPLLTPEESARLIPNASRIRIATVGIDAAVLPGAVVFREGKLQYDTPPSEVGQYAGSARPGDTGNVTLGGHVSSRSGRAVFRNLSKVVIGDLVEVWRGDELFRYEVTEIRLVAPNAIGVMAPTPDARVTLITCSLDPERSRRVVVVGKLLSASCSPHHIRWLVPEETRHFACRNRRHSRHHCPGSYILRLVGRSRHPVTAEQARMPFLSLSTTIKRARSAPMWALVGVIVGGAVLLAGSRTTQETGQSSHVAALVEEQISATPTASADITSTPTPTATATSTPAGSVVALRATSPSGLSNPPSIGFPAPPPKARQSLPNAAGIVRIVSPAIGLDHYIETVGVVNNQMQSPDADGSYAVGWYPDFGAPGVPGNAVFTAHETWNKMQGPFYNVHKAAKGDDIYLDMANGERRRYQVISLTRYPTESIPMSEVLWPTRRPADEEWITLYTCGGEIVYDASGYGDYLGRDVVVATLVK